MRYRLSPFNMAASLALGFCAYLFLHPGPWGLGVLPIVYLLIAIAILIIIDLTIQSSTTSMKRVFVIEGLMLLLFAGSFYWWWTRLSL